MRAGANSRRRAAVVRPCLRSGAAGAVRGESHGAGRAQAGAVQSAQQLTARIGAKTRREARRPRERATSSTPPAPAPPTASRTLWAGLNRSGLLAERLQRCYSPCRTRSAGGDVLVVLLPRSLPCCESLARLILPVRGLRVTVAGEATRAVHQDCWLICGLSRLGTAACFRTTRDEGRLCGTSWPTCSAVDDP